LETENAQLRQQISDMRMQDAQLRQQISDIRTENAALRTRLEQLEALMQKIASTQTNP
jgi:phage shock protein A